MTNRCLSRTIRSVARAAVGIVLLAGFSPVSATGDPADKLISLHQAIDPHAVLSPLVFNAAYYKQVNPDLAGLSNAEAQTHWLNHGAVEGRRAHPLFWSRQYLAYYPDLRAAFGPTNYPQAIEHYVDAGHKEGRAGVLALTPNVFDVKYYKRVYPDLASLSDADAEVQWIEQGIAAKRQADPRFYAPDYLFLNQDKMILYGPDNLIGAIDDYALKGFNQGRVGVFSLMPEVFDPIYYMSRHPELNFQSNDAAISYWLQTGLPRGDKGSRVFSPTEYLEQYPTLAQKFGATGYANALRHYVQTGRSEGLKGLFAGDQSYLAHIPISAGLKTTAADRVETFTSVTHKTITVVIKAPAPATNTTYTMRSIRPGESPDVYFPQAVLNATTAGAAILKFPKGVYNFQGANPNAHWTINGLTDMTIDGQGSTLNFSKPEFGVNINGPTRVVFKNFVIDWPNLKIAALGTIIPGPNGRRLLRIAPAYPFDASKSIDALSPWDVKQKSWGRQYLTEAFFNSDPGDLPVYQGDRTYSSPVFASYPVGAVLLVRFYTGQGAAFGIGGAQDFALENVVVHSAPGMAFFFSGGRGVRISNCEVNRSPGKLISSAMDAVHLGDVSGDVLVENGVFAYQGDDGFNLGGGSLLPVLGVRGVDVRFGQVEFTPQPGDPIMFLNSALGVLGYSTIKTASQGPGGATDVRLTSAIPHLTADCTAQDLNYMGSRWIVRNDRFLNNRARAMLPQTPYGLIQGNTMRGQTMASILAGTFNDAPPAAGQGVQDLQILDNRIEDAGAFAGSAFDPLHSAFSGGSAIMIMSYLTNEEADETGSTDTPVNQHIVLSGNTIKNVPSPAFFISSASDVTLSGNQIINSNLGPSYFLGTAKTSGSVVVSQAHNIAVIDTLLGGARTGRISIDQHSTSGIEVK